VLQIILFQMWLNLKYPRGAQPIKLFTKVDQMRLTAQVVSSHVETSAHA
jgi:hypothetical protein